MYILLIFQNSYDILQNKYNELNNKCENDKVNIQKLQEENSRYSDKINELKVGYKYIQDDINEQTNNSQKIESLLTEIDSLKLLNNQSKVLITILRIKYVVYYNHKMYIFYYVQELTKANNLLLV